jgi:small subunit ribosomal protein S9
MPPSPRTLPRITPPSQNHTRNSEKSQSVSQNSEFPDVTEDVLVVDEADDNVDSADIVDVVDVNDGDEEVVVVIDELPEVVPAAVLPVAVDRPVQTVGRRKEAIVRVRMVPGSGVFTLNGRTLDSYFPNKVHQQLIKEPLVVLEKAEIYDVHARLEGGGVTGQAGALRLAIARALIELDDADRPVLKKNGFLTRDARATERKKYGLKKARKAPQYSKR